MDLDTAIAGPQQQGRTSHTKLTRLCDAQSEHYYIYLTIEMELQQQGAEGPSSRRKPPTMQGMSILTFRKMLSSALQDLFGQAMGGGINIDILGFWTEQAKDPYNRMVTAAPVIGADNIPMEESATPSSLPTVSVRPSFSVTTAASAILRSHSLDINQLWNALTLFNTLVDDYEARFEVHYVSSTLLGLQANSRQLVW
ncbi:hypothetical protein BGZ70_009387 [Mortierella alpina]|uniref:Uncharacterized protein n=1 Tax=Mortierella alpina TaxID=64518 RepID=A0A9P6M6G4_MORAP|nr:hypothetical protein BGZ70_009387 [Mortierella alpina]